MTATDATPAPTMPYRVEMMIYGVDHVRATKVYPSGGGQLLSDEEGKVWEYLKHLEAENARLKADLESLLATPPAAEKKGKPKG